MTLVEGDRVARHKATHDLAEWRKTCAQQEMEVVWNERPGVALGLSFIEDQSKTFQEGLAVLVILEDLSTFNSPGHYMLQEARGIKSSLPRHRFFIYQRRLRVNRTFLSDLQVHMTK